MALLIDLKPDHQCLSCFAVLVGRVLIDRIVKRLEKA